MDPEVQRELNHLMMGAEISGYGKTRDLIYAPDGRTWFETALAEAEKRGKFRDALCMIARQELIVEMDKDQKKHADLPRRYDQMIVVARTAIA